jgi:glycosyltransferase involved in cell wall biosynthesis
MSNEPLRILAISELWPGSNGYGYVRAFRRMGHSVWVVPSERVVPSAWTSKYLRVLRRVLERPLVNEYNDLLVEEARRLNPHLFFVFKGRWVKPEAVKAIKEMGAVAVNLYPDVSFMAHGKYLPQALPEYDWIFQTKTFGLADLKDQLQIEAASYLPHSFDPEVHRPVTLDDYDHSVYECDVSFVGTWSPKKQYLLEKVVRALPEIKLRIWGEQWEKANSSLARWWQGRGSHGAEYAKALVGSRINLAILSEVRKGASSGDLTTSRTFQIPATGAFMLHERTAELARYFTENEECAAFGNEGELIEKIKYYLSHDAERDSIARSGRQRALDSEYFVDNRAGAVLKKFAELRVRRQQLASPAIAGNFVSNRYA